MHAYCTHTTVSLASSQCCWYSTLFELGTFDVLFLRYPQPHRAFSGPLLSPSHYYTRRHLSSSHVACWISNWSSVVCKINYRDGPCKLCVSCGRSRVDWLEWLLLICIYFNRHVERHPATDLFTALIVIVALELLKWLIYFVVPWLAKLSPRTKKKCCKLFWCNFFSWLLFVRSYGYSQSRVLHW